MKKKIILVIIILVFIVSGVIILLFINNKEYTIKFNTNGGSEMANIKTINKGEIVFPKKNPTKSGHFFNGWSLNGNLVLNGTKINENIELKALWIDEGYDYVSVTFSPAEGLEDQKILVERNQKINEPFNLTKKGLEFKGWYLNNEYFDFDSRITEDIILNAMWESSNKTNNCLNDSFKLVDSKCVKEISQTALIEYSCEDGWSLNEKTCVKANLSSEFKNATAVYSCQDGYSLNGDKCTKNVQISPTNSYKCNDGFLKGNGCYITYGRDIIASLDVCGYKNNRQYIIGEAEKLKTKCYNNGGKIQGGEALYGAGSCILSCYKEDVDKYIEDAIPYQTCPKGYTLLGGMCSGTKTINATIESYNCPEGYILNGNKCYEKLGEDLKQDANEKEYCKDGWTLKDKKCIKRIELEKLN